MPYENNFHTMAIEKITITWYSVFRINRIKSDLEKK